MAGDAHAADAAGAQIDIIGHITDHNYLELPFVDPNHLLAGRIELPQFEIYGIDMSITRHVAMMWLAGLLLFILLKSAFSGNRGRLANFFESIVVFIRDEVVLPNMGEAGRPYMPFFLTIFFFILFCNLLGLFPYSATATSNINVTAGLALCTFAVTQVTGVVKNGLFGYLKSFVPGGIPSWVLPILIPIEIVSLFIKPFALCVRLFANMVAGHVVILVFLGLIIMLGHVAVASISIPFATAIYLLEIFIAFVQAFIFTLLSAIFIGMAAHPDH
jgi:F-type H+-transporting ATPase subunit a